MSVCVFPSGLQSGAVSVGNGLGSCVTREPQRGNRCEAVCSCCPVQALSLIPPHPHRPDGRSAPNNSTTMFVFLRHTSRPLHTQIVQRPADVCVYTERFDFQIASVSSSLI